MHLKAMTDQSAGMHPGDAAPQVLFESVQLMAACKAASAPGSCSARCWGWRELLGSGNALVLSAIRRAPQVEVPSPGLQSPSTRALLGRLVPRAAAEAVRNMRSEGCLKLWCVPCASIMSTPSRVHTGGRFAMWAVPLRRHSVWLPSDGSKPLRPASMVKQVRPERCLPNLVGALCVRVCQSLRWPCGRRRSEHLCNG